MTEPAGLDAEPPAGLLDTSVLISAESGRTLRTQLLPAVAVGSVITLAELNAGVLVARDSATRARRLRTLTDYSALEVLDADAAAARVWAQMRTYLREVGRRMKINDLWIAAIAVAHQLPIVTQDDDFSALDGYPGISIIRV